jgi:hypothetical protein
MTPPNSGAARVAAMTVLNALTTWCTREPVGDLLAAERDARR